jgi:hypothetical protein
VAVTFPRTIAVLRVIMSSSDSRSSVALPSGSTQEATTIARMKYRFTVDHKCTWRASQSN